MPDVRPSPACDHHPSAHTPGCHPSEMEPCVSHMPPYAAPLSAFPRHRAPGHHQWFPLASRCNSSTLLSNLRHCPGQAGPAGTESRPDVLTGGRLYRSMENLNWNPVLESSLCSSSEFILRYTAASHWYDGPPDGSNPESLAYYPQHSPRRKDVPIFPQLLFPSGVDEWDARKGLREKLRLQSARSAVEPVKTIPLRTTESAPADPNLGCRRAGARLTCRDEIKQEVLRKLQLRRQNSSPNLAVHAAPCSAKVLPMCRTSAPILGGDSVHRSVPLARLYIPTFEEFKKMRMKDQNQVSTAGSDVSGPQCPTAGDGINSPIRIGPSPRTPLQSSSQGGSGDNGRRRRSSLEPVGSVPFLPRKDRGGRPSSCCPALLLEGTDLSSYGAKFYKMKDGLIGSALDLIKKSCSADISSEAPVRLSAERDRDATATPRQPPAAVSMATAAGAEAGHQTPAAAAEEEDGEGEGAGECLPGVCRRSSSDATYERSQAAGDCRLRARRVDLMPANDEMKAKMDDASHGRYHRRERDSAPAALRGHSEPPRDERPVGSDELLSSERRPGRGRRHRWSTISSLSADSGVVGLSEEDDNNGEPRRRRRGAEVERADSGIGPGLSRAWKRPPLCADCGRRDEASDGQSACERCAKSRAERKEAVLEFLNTECSYGEDLRIIKEEFYEPMRGAGLLSAEQLAVVFANVQELGDVNERFTEHLQDAIEHALDRGDEDLLTVSVGEIFLEFVNMLPAFQTYCLQQSASVNMLNALEKEKELLRIFLDVSQNDNTALRRMNLRSFLMAPLQRVTKYPLLLSRLLKVTPEKHPEFGRLREAKSRVEAHLEHINTKTKQQDGNGVASWSLRSFRRDSRKSREPVDAEMREASIKTLGWTREDARFVMEGPLQLSQPADGQWVKKGSKALKFQNVQSLLVVRTQPCQAGESVQDGVLVLIKDKSGGKFTVMREPIRLANCVVSMDPECQDTFEVLDIRREAFVFRAADKSRTHNWFNQMKRYARDLGAWRKRRNALPNIMINTAQSRS
ncbi:uncharacterized protein si:dkey-91i10.2 [Corythoichthys intestinalis]|uniref:uncharacterized protein si:dkey-91i10.2 n=1 Tax=Corythoichthys intestinalis TaxID=161448 RepID=UPI0025A5C0D3|nr:uncharacterized protein si:dkey-91i10.2 [Corythoichthys intestinalis]XP_057708309.1 uncharacterized protein si:dkey-91i10.2 [Corythoichthys intestinalis]XP_057708310.1 uncharacterized protein si:dkey-91i10.2 [Corythoichthys intestinalis]XP_061799505.1 uncharacterized protein LOC133590893 [Nerophis lumbriciformis]